MESKQIMDGCSPRVVYWAFMERPDIYAGRGKRVWSYVELETK
jgi:hypothetical protein